MFLEALAAYRVDLGKAFPVADPRSVLFVLRECSSPEPKSQKQVEKAAGISQSNLAKLMAKMIDVGWLEASTRNPKTGVKTFHVSYDGQVVLMDFEAACQKAIKSIPKAKRSRGGRLPSGLNEEKS
jgi:hypothetical protein